MSDWITDRPPTRADADINGQIVVRHDGLIAGSILHAWNAILPGTLWSHTSLYRHTIEPAPEPPPAEPEPQPAPEPAPVSPAPEISPAPELPEALRTIAIPRRCVSISWTINELDCLTFNAIDDDGAAWVLHPGATEWHRLTPPEPAPEPPPAEPEPQPAPEPAPVSPARRFVSISRTINVLDRSTLDAIDDEGIAWVLHPGATEWERLIALPAREVPAQ